MQRNTVQLLKNQVDMKNVHYWGKQLLQKSWYGIIPFVWEDIYPYA